MAISVLFAIPNGASISSSGVGFFGSGGFGFSVPVGEFQGSTYCTNSAGSLQGPALSNVKYIHANSGLVAGSTILNLRAIPNNESTFEIRITSDDAVSLQNSRLYVTERASTTGMPAGMTIYAAEIDNTGTSQLNIGLGSVAWSGVAGTGAYLALGNSPGLSGAASGSSTSHSYYIALSCSPNSVGSKTATARFQTEYL